MKFDNRVIVVVAIFGFAAGYWLVSHWFDRNKLKFVPPPPGELSEEMRDTIRLIRGFIDGTGDRWDWDDVIAVTGQDPDALALKRFCDQLDVRYPRTAPGRFCNEEGLKHLARVVDRIEAEKQVRPEWFESGAEEA